MTSLLFSSSPFHWYTLTYPPFFYYCLLFLFFLSFRWNITAILTYTYPYHRNDFVLLTIQQNIVIDAPLFGHPFSSSLRSHYASLPSLDVSSRRRKTHNHPLHQRLVPLSLQSHHSVFAKRGQNVELHRNLRGRDKKNEVVGLPPVCNILLSIFPSLFNLALGSCVCSWNMLWVLVILYLELGRLGLVDDRIGYGMYFVYSENDSTVSI